MVEGTLREEASAEAALVEVADSLNKEASEEAASAVEVVAGSPNAQAAASVAAVVWEEVVECSAAVEEVAGTESP